MDLVYTNDSMSAVGYLDFVGFDLSIGDSGNQVQVKLHSDQKTDLVQGSLVYVPESEYGGIIKSINSKIETDGQRYVYYSGPSWSGRLQERIVKPPSGQDHYTMDGEANDELNRLMKYLDLDYLFEAPDVDSGIELDIDIDRFADGYSALRKVATAYDCRLSMVYSNVSKKVAIQLIKREVHGNTSDSSPISVTVDKPVNHLICAGQGELQDRVVIDLYIGADGSIQNTPYYTGADSIEALYENTSADADKLNEEGAKKLQDLQNVNQVNISVDDSSEDLYPLDDVISGIDPVTGIQASSTIAKKVVSVDYRGFETYRYEAAEVGSTVTASLSTETSSGGGGGGATYTEGYGINISNNTISADVGTDELEAVQKSVATANLNANNAITAASNATSAATDAANAASSAINAAATAQQTADGKADAEHTHSASDVTSGKLAISRGGTNAETATEALFNLIREIPQASQSMNLVVLLGDLDGTAENSAIKYVTPSDFVALFQYYMSALPINKGGTGATTVVQALENLGAAAESDLENYLPLHGTADAAKKLDTPCTITLTGAVNGSASFDGSDDIVITTTGDSEAASFLAAHPVGSIYATSVHTNPQVTYGGTWQELPSADSFKYVRTA